MLTIKQFASLCGCNTQTLRYYDKIDLLKPVKVAPWSGYRYYAKSQAIDFVKIKNLQAADFTIEEIRMLLGKSDTEVYEAFERKIRLQTQKLERIKEIQQSYLTEVNTMKRMINSFCDHLLERANDPHILREFGMCPDDSGKLVEAIRKLMLFKAGASDAEPCTVTMVVEDGLLEGPEALKKMTFMVREEDLDGSVHLTRENVVKEPYRPSSDMETIWSVKGWEYVHEVIPHIPLLDKDGDYTFLLHVCNKPGSETLSYPLFMIAAMLLKENCYGTAIHCIVEDSEDGDNHFTLLQKK